MDWTLAIGLGAMMQVFFSAVAFGVPHGIWAFFRGSFAAGLGAILATGILGGMLAIVYLLSNRNLGPCIAAHFWSQCLRRTGPRPRGDSWRNGPRLCANNGVISREKQLDASYISV